MWAKIGAAVVNNMLEGIANNTEIGQETIRTIERAKKIKLFFLFGMVFTIVLAFLLVVILIIGLLEGNSNNSDYRSVYSTYGYCDSINVNGTLYSLEDYVAGVVEHEAYTSEGEEALKAQAVAARTYAINYTGGCQRAIGNSQASQTFSHNPGEKAKNAAQSTAGEILFYDNNIFSAMYDSFCYADKDCPDSVKNADGSYTVTYKKMPKGESHKITLNDSSLYGRIVPGGGHASGMSQLVSYQLAKNGMTYDQILKYFYSDGVEIVSILPGESGNPESQPGEVHLDAGKGYISTYTNVKNGNTYKNYKQCQFGVSWICQSGCLLTSISVIIEPHNSKITPYYLWEKHRDKEGAVYPNNYFSLYYGKGRYERTSERVSKNKEKLINHLSKGKTAILLLSKDNNCSHINGIKWTGSTHYIAVLDYNSSNNKIYISNPGTVNPLKNGWIDIDAFDCAQITYYVY